MLFSQTMSPMSIAALGIVCAMALSAQTVTFSSIPVTNGPATSLTVGPDGNICFVEGGFSQATVKIGRLTTSGTLTEFPTGIGTGGVCVASITAGPDGNLWVGIGNAIGPGTFGPVLRVNTSGVV